LGFGGRDAQLHAVWHFLKASLGVFVGDVEVRGGASGPE
jgi:hypothetical protein